MAIKEDKIKYDAMARNNFECVTQFKCLGALITFNNDICEGIEKRTQIGNNPERTRSGRPMPIWRDNIVRDLKTMGIDN